MANVFSDSQFGDDKEIILGDGNDFRIAYDSADNRLEIRDSASAVIGHLSTSSAFTFAGAITASDDLTVSKFMKLTKASTAIASGAITATTSWMQLDTEAAAASDDLDTINGGEAGAIVILRTTSSSRDVVVRHLGGGTGNIRLNGATDFTLVNTSSRVMLMYDDGLSLWVEIGRGNN